ncbi:putative pseudouridine synthase I, TruA [Dioscorea sansibarensis]
MLDGDEDDSRCNALTKPITFSISKVKELCRQLEGKALSYKMFAQDTKASRSVRPPTECFMFRARATESRLPPADEVSVLLLIYSLINITRMMVIKCSAAKCLYLAYICNILGLK